MANMRNANTISVEVAYQIVIPDEDKMRRFEFAPNLGPRVVLLTGGAGSGTLSEGIKRYTHNSVHIVTMFDDGGSSRLIREALDMPPPGDLRDRLMHLADMTQRGNPAVAGVFRKRLGLVNAREEFETFLYGTHNLMLSVPEGLRRIICDYLKEFARQCPSDFDFCRGSIGNFVMTGSYLVHDRNIESAVYVISSLAHVLGKVIPVALGNYHLAAELDNGDLVLGQARITRGELRATNAIKRLFFVERKTLDAPAVDVKANPRAVQAIMQADLIVYGVGSFYTSLVPCLMTSGVGSAIRLSPAPKVLIANPTADSETFGLKVSHMVAEGVRYCKESDTVSGSTSDYIGFVVANHHGDTGIYRGVGPDPERGIYGYIPVDKATVREMGVEVLEYPLEIPAERGHFDPDLLARIILSFAQG